MRQGVAVGSTADREKAEVQACDPRYSGGHTGQLTKTMSTNKTF